MRRSSTVHWGARAWRTWGAFLIGLAAGAGFVGIAHAENDLQIRGLVDIVGHGNDTDLFLNRTMYGTTNFDNLHVRVFLEGGSERTRAFLQLLVSDVGYSNFRFYGGYLQHQLFEGREIYAEAGKIPVHDGTWAARTYSDKNPLVGIPLAYSYKSTLPFRQMPLDLDQLLAQRGKGQSGVNYTNPDGSPRGVPWSSLPIMYDNCWDYGAFFLGAGGRFDYCAGVSFGAPGASVAGPDTNDDLAIHAKVGFAPVPALKLHLLFARGAYLYNDVTAYVPAGARIEDYMQTLWGGSLEWGWRHLTVNSEIFHNQFETPIHAGGLGNVSWYAETVYKFLPGWHVAGRYDTMRYSRVATATGPVTWDDNIQRVEVGCGYHLTRDLLVKGVGQLNERGDGWDMKSLLPAVQVSFRY